jgi:hypothetical protein
MPTKGQDKTYKVRYEMLLTREMRSCWVKNGQFRTPRHIIKLLVELVDPIISIVLPTQPPWYWWFHWGLPIHEDAT